MKARRELALRESLSLFRKRVTLREENRLTSILWPNYVGFLYTCEVDLDGETQWPLKTISGLRISRAQACRRNKGVPTLINSFLCGPAPTDPRTGGWGPLLYAHMLTIGWKWQLPLNVGEFIASRGRRSSLPVTTPLVCIRGGKNFQIWDFVQITLNVSAEANLKQDLLHEPNLLPTPGLYELEWQWQSNQRRCHC